MAAGCRQTREPNWNNRFQDLASRTAGETRKCGFGWLSEAGEMKSCLQAVCQLSCAHICAESDCAVNTASSPHTSSMFLIKKGETVKTHLKVTLKVEHYYQYFIFSFHNTASTPSLSQLQRKHKLGKMFL